MAALSTLTFAVPWLLAGLAVLPLLFIFCACSRRRRVSSPFRPSRS